MMLEIEKGTLLALHLGRMKDEGTVRPEPISVGKLGRVGGPVRRIRYTGFREILFYELL